MIRHENLKGRVAVVTGGGGVLCSSFAKDLAASGVKVAVLDIRKEAAQAVATCSARRAWNRRGRR